MEAFQSILDRNPNHPEAAYNVFVLKKLLQQRGRMGKPVDPGLLKICLNENGDRPAYVVHFVEWARKDIQADSGKSVDNFVYWMRKIQDRRWNSFRNPESDPKNSKPNPTGRPLKTI